ncbi:hypothetical protein B0T16DRAFT_421304 [Cercophora newfieldiana]|uniref:Uncharacterized protein n=1 Tax=Cercophora newfieldiana TaxID=92897 RepID=A0AA39XQU0_9PEZI|nr:hypothetical protein B0T16DRAFT_421304 [Cercophora newfieldiana]
MDFVSLAFPIVRERHSSTSMSGTPSASHSWAVSPLLNPPTSRAARPPVPVSRGSPHPHSLPPAKLPADFWGIKVLAYHPTRRQLLFCGRTKRTLQHILQFIQALGIRLGPLTLPDTRSVTLHSAYGRTEPAIPTPTNAQAVDPKQTPFPSSSGPD